MVRVIPAARARRRYAPSGALVSHGPVRPSPWPAWQWLSMISIEPGHFLVEQDRCGYPGPEVGQADPLVGAAHHGAEGRRLPLHGGPRRLDVVVAVDKDGRAARRLPPLAGDHGRGR